MDLKETKSGIWDSFKGVKGNFYCNKSYDCIIITKIKKN